MAESLEGQQSGGEPASSSATTPYDILIQEQIGLSKRQEAQAEKAAAEQKPYYEDIQQFEKESATRARENLPKYQDIPNPPNTVAMTEPTNLQKTFGIASIFALLAAGITKDHTMAGLTALGGFIEGSRAGQLERAQAALVDFNNNFKVALARNKMAQEQYYDILNSDKLTLEAKQQALRTKMLENHDQDVIFANEEKGIDGILKALANRDRAQAQMQNQWMSMQRLQAQIQHWKTTGAGAANAAETVFGIPMSQIPTVEPGEKNEKFLSMLPPATAQLVKDMAEGKLPVSGFGGFDVKTRSNLVKAADLYAPGSFDARKYAVGAKALTELTPGGPVGANVLAINTMAHHIDQFGKDFAKLNNSQVQKWNDAINKLSAEFGDPALAVVQQDAMRVADEYAKIVKGGKASPTEEDMRLWERIFRASMSPAQMRATVWNALEGAGGRLKAMQDAYSDFPDAAAKMLSPETKDIINRWKPKSVPTPTWLKEPAGQRADNIAQQNQKTDADIQKQLKEWQRLRPGYEFGLSPSTGKIFMRKPGGQWQTPQ